MTKLDEFNLTELGVFIAGVCASLGALFFQPPERMYLKLNNPNEIYLNDIDVEFVYSDERLCTSLVGKTIVCFHIRKSKEEIKMK